MSVLVRPHRRQSTRLSHPWGSPGKNTGVGCHFLLQCMKVKSESEVTQSCPTLSDPMDCSPPGSSAHGIFQARVVHNSSYLMTLPRKIFNLLTISSYLYSGFPCGSAGKESAHSAGDLGLISGLGRSPGEGKGCPLQYSA